MSWIQEIYSIPKEKKYSQYGEEHILEFIFKNIGETNKMFVEFGAGDACHLSNTLYFKEKGWTGLWMEGSPQSNPDIHQEFVTKHNIVALFQKYKVPAWFDLLSIDIDGNDYWVLDSILTCYMPRVVVAEFNCCIPADQALTINYDPEFKWNGDNYFGMSLAAGKRLAEKHGYSLIFQNDGVNFYLVRNELLNGVEIPEVKYEQYFAFPQSPRTDWVQV